MLAPAVLTADVRFEGGTHEDWIRFVRLWQPRSTPEREPTRPRGGVVVVHEDGQVLKVLHTKRGRLDPAAAQLPPAQADARALALRALPVPTANMLRRTLDAVCADGKTLTLGLFDESGLWTCFVARRRGGAF